MSQVFVPYRALGLITDSVPFSLLKRGKEHTITTSIGHAFQIYDAAKLRLLFVSPTHPARVTSVVALKDSVFSACEANIYVWHRAKLVNVVQVGAVPILSLQLFGDVLLALDAAHTLHAFTTRHKQQRLCELTVGSDANPVTVFAHPNTYLNKILIGRNDGSLQLWNLKSCKLIYSFKGWGSAITCLMSSPAIDVMGIGLADGRIMLHNLRVDELVLSFAQRTAVTAMAFRSDSYAWLATGDGKGQIAFWSLGDKKLLALLPRAHGQGSDTDSIVGAMTSAKDTFGEEETVTSTFNPLSTGRGVTSLAFLTGEPVLVSSGGDNALKMWLCEDSTARLLRERSGHGAPPSVVHFYRGGSNGGFGASRELLSAGRDNALRMFSLIQDQQSRELSQGKLAKRAKKMGRHERALKLSPITAIASCGARERMWDNVVTAHSGKSAAYTWSYVNRRLGKHKMVLKDKSKSKKLHSTIQSIAMSRCGSFAFLGSASGWLDKYNVQSGAHRGSAKWSASLRRAHSAAITGIACDPLNRTIITCSLDSTIRWWRLKDLQPLHECIMDTGAAFSEMHFEGQLLAVACDDLIIRVYDTEQRRLVRRLWPQLDDSAKVNDDKNHKDKTTDADSDQDDNDDDAENDAHRNAGKRGKRKRQGKTSPKKQAKISDKQDLKPFVISQATSMCFSPDARWLVVGAINCVRLYDIPSGTMIDWFRCERPVTSVAFSPFGDFLATTHVNRRGVYLWANVNYFSRAFLKPPPRVPQLADLPNALRVRASNEEYVDGVDDAEFNAQPDDDAADADNSAADASDASVVEKYAQQLSDGLVTLSDVPRSHWETLAQLDIIRQRNKPITAPEKPAAAPFFLPTLPGVQPEFIIDTDNDKDETEGASSRILNMNEMRPRSVFLDVLSRTNKTTEEFRELATILGKLSPSKVDFEIRQLRAMPETAVLVDMRSKVFGGDDNGDESEAMDESERCEHTLFLKFLLHELNAGRHYELVQAWLETFLRIHSTDLLTNRKASAVLSQLRAKHDDVWQRLDDLYVSSLCLLDHFAGLSMEF